MSKDQTDSIGTLWLRNGLIWLALLLLLALTLVLAYVPLGVWNGPVSLLIAALKALLVLALYMELRRGSALLRLIAFVPLIFVVILYSLSLSDVFTRY